jgi:hypothetical protein
MAITLEELEQRVTLLEREITRLQERVEGPRPEETPAERGARRFREAKASQPAITAAVTKAFEQMGITGEPISAQEFEKLMAECGIDPSENLLSREILAMREE